MLLTLFGITHYVMSLGIVSLLHQNEGGIKKSIPNTQEISGDQRDFQRANVISIYVFI